MQDLVDITQAHEWTLRRLREMAGRLTEQAYMRACEAAGGEPEDAQRWMLVFDRMARGLRLTLALEARLAREPVATASAAAPRRAPATEHLPCGSRDPCEADRERDDDGLPDSAPIGERIGRLKAIIEEAAAAAPEPVLHAGELEMLEPQRAARARHAGSLQVPPEPWDLGPHPKAAHPRPPPWRDSG